MAQLKNLIVTGPSNFLETPNAPTAESGTNDTQVATTAFVNDAISGKESTSNKVTSISSSSTDTQYPSAKCIYDSLVKTTNQVTARSGATLSAGIVIGNSSGYINAAANVVFDQTYPILYYAGGLGYTTYSGVTQTGALGGNEMWYLKCSKSGSTLTISSITSTVPQAADNYVYIPLGTSKTVNKIEFRSSNQLFAFSDEYFQEVSNVPILSYRESTGNAIELYEGEIVDCGTISNPEFDLIVGGNDIGEYRVFFTCGLSGMSLTFNDVIVNWKEIPQMVEEFDYEINILRAGNNKFYGIIVKY